MLDSCKIIGRKDSFRSACFTINVYIFILQRICISRRCFPGFTDQQPIISSLSVLVVLMYPFSCFRVFPERCCPRPVNLPATPFLQPRTCAAARRHLQSVSAIAGERANERARALTCCVCFVLATATAIFFCRTSFNKVRHVPERKKCFPLSVQGWLALNPRRAP